MKTLSVVLMFGLLTMGRAGTAAESELVFSSKPVWTSGTRNSGGDGNARFIDADRDGDLDLVTSLPGPRRWVLFENRQGKLGTKPVWESFETTDCDHVSVLDYNNDGWMDLAGTHESHCTLYLNRKVGSRGKAFSQQPDWETGQFTDANQIDFGDYDRDGDQDMLMASGLPVYQVALFEARAGTPSRTVSQTLGVREYSESSIFADVDGDGDLDVVATYGKRGTVRLHRNNDGAFDAGTTIHSDPANAWCQRVYCVDLDGDGQRELFCAKGPWGPPAASIALVRAAGSNAWRVGWQTDRRTGYHGFDFRDINGDGALDVAAADWAGRRVAIYLQRDGKLPTKPSWSARTSGPAHEVHLGDLDGDGDLDVAVGGVDQAQVFENRSPPKKK